MKKSNLILAVLLLLFNCQLLITRSFAQTSIPGGLVSGTWTLAGSPYLIQGTIQIANADSLIIQPGVTVNFQGTYKLNVQGKLIAVGTATDTIVFTSANTTNGWRGIRFDNTPTTNDSSKINYCKLQYGKATGTFPSDCGGALFFDHFSKTIISNSCILNCSANFNGAGIYCSWSSPVIINNIINNNTSLCYDAANFSYNGGGAGIFCDYFSSPIISQNIISYNTAINSGGGKGAGIYSDGSPIITNNTIVNNTAGLNGGGICCFSSSSGIISENTISYNSCNSVGGGIFCGSINSPTILRNIISNNTANNGAGFFLTASTNPTLSDNIICNNTSVNNGGAFYCESNSSPTIINATVVNNTAVNGGALFCINSNPVFKNTIFYGNEAGTSGAQVFLFDEGSDPGFYYCDVQGGSATFELNGNFYSGTYQNNIDALPVFMAPSGGSGNSFNGITANWSLQNGSPCIDTGDPTMISTSTDLAGNPRVVICRIDMGAYEYQNGLPFQITIVQSKQILCNGASTAQLVALPSGGTQPYTFLWNGGSTNDTLSNLQAGTYTVTVGNASGCSRTETFTITEPTGMSLSTSQINIGCSGNCTGSATVFPTGGTTPYHYLWSSSVNDTATTTPSTLCSGPYTITVTDNQGCVKTATVTITTPSSLSFTINNSDVSCFGSNTGSISINATGGVLPLTYSINGGTNYQLSNSFSGLNAGTYNVVVKDNNGCQTNVVNTVINQPQALSATTTHTDINCYGATNGTATAIPNGGTGVYSYTWNSTPVQTAATATNLSSGSYTVTVTDQNLCSTTASATIISTLPTATICMVTVDSLSINNEIYWDKTPPEYASIDSIIIFRYDVITSNYLRIGAVSKNALSMFTDTSRTIGGPNGGDPQYSSYQYKLALRDTCGNFSSLSLYHQSIFVQQPGGGSSFSWNAYMIEGVPSVTGYQFMRDDNGTGVWNVLVNTASLATTDPNYLSYPNGKWRVQALGLSCTPTRVSVNTTRSNIKHQGIAGVESTGKLFSSISIYPNPANSNMTITSKKELGTIIIYNTLGEAVVQTKSRSKQMILDVSKLNAGIYFVNAGGSYAIVVIE